MLVRAGEVCFPSGYSQPSRFTLFFCFCQGLDHNHHRYRRTSSLQEAHAPPPPGPQHSQAR